MKRESKQTSRDGHGKAWMRRDGNKRKERKTAGTNERSLVPVSGTSTPHD